GDAGAEQAEEGGLVGGHRRKGKQRKVGHTLRARERTVKRLLAWLAVLGLLPLSAAAQNVTYIHTDALGSPVLETNAQAQVVRQVDYRAYGMEVMDAPRPGPGYTGHYRDVGTGLVYMQQRYYDPVVGRFLSADPVATDTKNGWNLNRYNYAANNPYKFTDPDGREIRIIGSEEFVKRIEAQLADAEAASTKIADMVGGLRDSANVHEIRDISESPRNQLQSHNIATDPSAESN